MKKTFKRTFEIEIFSSQNLYSHFYSIAKFVIGMYTYCNEKVNIITHFAPIWGKRQFKS